MRVTYRPRKPSPAIAAALRDFVIRHHIFVEASEIDDGVLFTRQLTRHSTRVRPRRYFEVFLRRRRRRVRFFTVACGSEDLRRSSICIDFPEKLLLEPAEAALEYEGCGREVRRYTARFPHDRDVARGVFGYLRSESHLLVRLLGGSRYKELLRLMRCYKRKAAAGETVRTVKRLQPRTTRKKGSPA